MLQHIKAIEQYISIIKIQIDFTKIHLYNTEKIKAIKELQAIKNTYRRHNTYRKNNNT